MEAWTLFARALRLIADNLDVALRLSVLPYGLAAAAQLLTLALGGGAAPLDPAVLELPPPEGGADPAFEMMVDPRVVWTSILSGVLFLIALLWVAVGWHRFALLGEVPEGWVPPFDGARVLGYLGRSVLLALLVAVVTVGVSVPLGLVGLPLGAAGAALTGGAALVLAMVLFYRLSVVLPAAAAGRPIGMRDAWSATQGHSGTAVGLALLTFGLSLLLQLPTALDAMLGVAGPVVTAVYQIAVGWIGLMVGVAVLTVFYVRTVGPEGGADG